MVVTIDAPATVTRGVPTPVYLRLADAANSTYNHPATTDYTLRISLGGAAAGSIDVRYLAHPGIPVGTPWAVERTANLTFMTAGSTTLTATYHHFGSVPTNSVCRANDAPPVAEIINVIG